MKKRTTGLLLVFAAFAFLALGHKARLEEAYFGVYEITEFWPENISWATMQEECLPREEVDLLIGRRIVLSDRYYSAYDNYRFHGDLRFKSDYFIQRYVIENPQYIVMEGPVLELIEWVNLTSDDMEREMEYPYRKIQLKQHILLNSNTITEPESNPSVWENYDMVPTLYVLKNDRLLWVMGRSGHCFILEKTDLSAEEEWEFLEKPEVNVLPEEVEGDYEITKFYPNVYWEKRPAYSVCYLSEKDAESMIGRRISIEKDGYSGYVYDFTPNFLETPPEYPTILEALSENPQYTVKDVKKEELYGLHDNIVPREYEQKVYQEIKVAEDTLHLELDPWNHSPAKYYILEADRDKLLMVYAGEFFLLERCGTKERSSC